LLSFKILALLHAGHLHHISKMSADATDYYCV